MYLSLRETSSADILFLSEIGSTTELINEAYSKSPHYDYYHVTNDDFIYHTKDWDKILIEEIESRGGLGIAYGNDLFNGRNLPVTSVISANIIRSLGWLQLPGLQYLYGDMVWKFIGETIGFLYYRHDVIIEHEHARNHKADNDSVYEKTNSREVYDADGKVYDQWRKYYANEDLRKIRLAMSRLPKEVFV